MPFLKWLLDVIVAFTLLLSILAALYYYGMTIPEDGGVEVYWSWLRVRAWEWYGPVGGVLSLIAFVVGLIYASNTGAGEELTAMGRLAYGLPTVFIFLNGYAFQDPERHGNSILETVEQATVYQLRNTEWYETDIPLNFTAGWMKPIRKTIGDVYQFFGYPRDRVPEAVTIPGMHWWLIKAIYFMFLYSMASKKRYNIFGWLRVKKPRRLIFLFILYALKAWMVMIVIGAIVVLRYIIKLSPKLKGKKKAGTATAEGGKAANGRPRWVWIVILLIALIVAIGIIGRFFFGWF